MWVAGSFNIHLEISIDLLEAIVVCPVSGKRPPIELSFAEVRTGFEHSAPTWTWTTPSLGAAWGWKWANRRKHCSATHQTSPIPHVLHHTFHSFSIFFLFLCSWHLPGQNMPKPLNLRWWMLQPRQARGVQQNTDRAQVKARMHTMRYHARIEWRPVKDWVNLGQQKLGAAQENGAHEQDQHDAIEGNDYPQGNLKRLHGSGQPVGVGPCQSIHWGYNPWRPQHKSEDM